MVGLPEWPPCSLRCVALRCAKYHKPSLQTHYFIQISVRFSQMTSIFYSNIYLHAELQRRRFHYVPPSYEVVSKESKTSMSEVKYVPYWRLDLDIRFSNLQ